jgi:hypothetical protein
MEFDLNNATALSTGWNLNTGGIHADEYIHKSNLMDRFASRLLNLNTVNQLIFVMVKCGVLFEVRTEFLNNI